MNKELKRTNLINALKEIPIYMSERLSNLKAEKVGLERPDFIWHYLLQSFSTMGNSRGHEGLILNKSNYNEVTFEAVSKLNENERLERFKNVLFRAKVRMPIEKANWLSSNYKKIILMGGLEETKKRALSKKGTLEKIEFLKQFNGIGDKYGRNIWMDVYHPDFHNTIAVDERIKQITKSLGYEFFNYQDEENFYLDIAKEANLNGWELDRLLYNYKDYFLAKIGT